MSLHYPARPRARKKQVGGKIDRQKEITQGDPEGNKKRGNNRTENNADFSERYQMEGDGEREREKKKMIKTLHHSVLSLLTSVWRLNVMKLEI